MTSDEQMELVRRMPPDQAAAFASGLLAMFRWRPDLRKSYSVADLAYLESVAGDQATSYAKHRFATTQLNLLDAKSSGEGTAVPVLREMQEEIPEGDLVDGGKPLDLHITALYGLHDQDPQEVAEAIRGAGPVVVRLGETSVFENPEADVVKVDVVEGVDGLRKMLERLPYTETHDGYRPHVTLAYVKPGTGASYAGDQRVYGMELVFDRLVFSDKEGNQTTIRLTGNEPEVLRYQMPDQDDEVPDFHALAAWYADLLNAYLASGQGISVQEMDHIADELASGDWSLNYNQKTQQWEVVHASAAHGPVQYAVHHAPKGGVTINGKHFRGGQFIPAGDYAKADEATKEKIDAPKRQRQEKRRARGPVDRDKFRDSLQEHDRHALTDTEKMAARRSFNALKKHHGDLTLHRLEELANDLRVAVNGTNDPAAKERFSRRLAAIRHMIDLDERHVGKTPWQVDGGRPEFGKVYNVPTESLQVDPGRFQFKLNVNKEGVTQELKSVQTWNPDFAGVLAVWRDPQDGKTYVVNGHHRRELAGRLGAKDLAVRYLDAPDAVQARALGALINIAEGRGTAVDAAKFMRDSGTTPEGMAAKGVSLKGKLAEEAGILTRLSDRVFDRVARGTFDTQKALAIAKHLGDHDLQGKLVSLLDKREEDGKADLAQRTIEEMAREMAQTPKLAQTEHSLFGDIETEESLFTERNEIKAHVRAQLAMEVNDFAAVGSQRRADRVSGAGNVLDVASNQKIAQEGERVKNAFDKLVNSKGMISDAVNAAAKQMALAKGKKAKDAARNAAVAAVKDAIYKDAGVGRSVSREEKTPPPPGQNVWAPNVFEAGEDGVTHSARIGVPAMAVPPPPSVGQLPNLTPHERKVESQFREKFHVNPDKMASDFLSLVHAVAAKKGGAPTFGTDDAKALSSAWSSPELDADLAKRSQNRATLNVALHQTANAIAKRSFVKHLDTLQPGDEIMVTVGGCGAGKGYALDNVPKAVDLRNKAKAVWDSAGDQNATENPWIQREAEKRGLKVNYVFVHADPRNQWANPDRGVVKRAGDPKDGRMVDADVFADSYAIGAKNHQAFYERHQNNPNANFVFLENAAKPRELPGIPPEMLNLDRNELAKFARQAARDSGAPDHVVRGATIGERIWGNQDAGPGGFGSTTPAKPAPAAKPAPVAAAAKPAPSAAQVTKPATATPPAAKPAEPATAPAAKTAPAEAGPSADNIHAAYESSKGMTDERFAEVNSMLDKASKDQLQGALTKMKMRFNSGDSRDKLASQVKQFISARRGANQQMAQIGPHPYSTPPGNARPVAKPAASGQKPHEMTQEDFVNQVELRGKTVPAESADDMRARHRKEYADHKKAGDDMLAEASRQKAKAPTKAAKDAVERDYRNRKDEHDKKGQEIVARAMKEQNSHPEIIQERRRAKEAVDKKAAENQARIDSQRTNQDNDLRQKLAERGGTDAELARVQSLLDRAERAKKLTKEANRWKIDSRINTLKREIDAINRLSAGGKIPPSAKPS